jgi:8-O-methyltransferase
MKIVRGDCPAQVLYAALDSRLFDHIHGGTSAEVAGLAGVDALYCADVLDVLVGLGLLQRNRGQYRHTAASRRYLVSSSDSYLGEFLGVVRTTVYDTWSRLPQALVSGQAQTQDPDKGGFNGREHRDPARMRNFFVGLDAVSDAIASRLAAVLDGMQQPELLDVGGSRGHLAARLVEALPGARGVVFDLERTRPLFDDHMRELGQPADVSFLAGDFLADALPASDVAVLGHVLHGFGESQRRELLANVRRSVRPGGRVLIYDRMMDAARIDVDEVLGSLHMRLVSASGSEYTPLECAGWLECAGFHTPQASDLVDGYTLVSARA